MKQINIKLLFHSPSNQEQPLKHGQQFWPPQPLHLTTHLDIDVENFDVLPWDDTEAGAVESVGWGVEAIHHCTKGGGQVLTPTTLKLRCCISWTVTNNILTVQKFIVIQICK